MPSLLPPPTPPLTSPLPYSRLSGVWPNAPQLRCHFAVGRRRDIASRNSVTMSKRTHTQRVPVALAVSCQISESTRTSSRFGRTHSTLARASCRQPIGLLRSTPIAALDTIENSCCSFSLSPSLMVPSHTSHKRHSHMDRCVP